MTFFTFSLNSKTNDDTTLLVAALEERLKALMGDVATLNAAHALLRNDTKACCQNETGLPLLIQSAVAAEAAKFQVKETHAGIAAGGLSEDRVMLLIQNALAIYEADKTGRVDYALESAGQFFKSFDCFSLCDSQEAASSVRGALRHTTVARLRSACLEFPCGTPLIPHALSSSRTCSLVSAGRSKGPKASWSFSY
ncbi:MAG: hypothetical protein V2I33_21475 [Kangiellaceae bacterium]|jgi:hypothetical protein|nr:hypothetical protein [Kangiellaceae bacterium]